MISAFFLEIHIEILLNLFNSIALDTMPRHQLADIIDDLLLTNSDVLFGHQLGCQQDVILKEKVCKLVCERRQIGVFEERDGISSRVECATSILHQHLGIGCCREKVDDALCVCLIKDQIAIAQVSGRRGFFNLRFLIIESLDLIRH